MPRIALAIPLLATTLLSAAEGLVLDGTADAGAEVHTHPLSVAAQNYTLPATADVTLRSGGMITLRPGVGIDAAAALSLEITPATDPGSAGLVLHLPLDENSGTLAADLSGLGHDGTLVSGVAFDPTGGHVLGAAAFDGSGAGIDVADHADLNTGTYTQRTISLWYRATDTVTRQMLFESGGGTRGFSIYLDAGTLYVGAWNDDGAQSGWTGTFLQTPAPGDGAWHHVALVLDGGTTIAADALEMFHDGVSVGSGSGSQLWSHSGDIGIGAMDDDSRFHDGTVTGDGVPFAGSLDELRLYNRALGASEIAWLATEYRDPPAPPAGDPKLAHGTLSGVGSGWQALGFAQSYTSPVFIATVGYGSGDAPAVVRVRDLGPDGCELRVQNPVADGALSGYEVHWVLVEEGVYTQAEHGVTMEAVRVDVAVTAAKNAWGNLQAQPYANSYTSPVVLGQVMTANDAGWSSFAAFGATAADPPGSSLQITKHVGEDPTTARASETVGLLVVEAGQASVGGVALAAGLGADSVGGVGNSPPYSYAITGPSDPTTAILASAGMDGGDGGWPVLWGAAPLSATSIALAYDEDQGADSERGHTTEQVAWLVLGADEPPPPPVDPKLHHGIAATVGDTWTTVPLPAIYTAPVVVATPVQVAGGVPVVTRVRNVGSTGFELRVQDPAGSALSGVAVHYLVIEQGVFTAAEHGFTAEAASITSSVTAHDGDWNAVTPVAYQQAYTTPVVLGQVMSANDPAWSTFYADGGTSADPPSATGLRIGKQVAEDPAIIRADETLGYVVFESGSGTVSATGLAWQAGLGADTVLGVGDAPPYAYTATGAAAGDSAILGVAGMDGVNGGWPVLWGPDPVTTDAIALAFDEDTINDSERAHTSEQVAYVVLEAVSTLPTAVDDLATTDEDTPVLIDVLANDSDPAGQTLGLVSVTQGSIGSTVLENGQVRYSPAPDQNGSDAFTYTMADSDGNTAIASVTVTVNAVNDPPDAVATADLTVVDVNGSVQFDGSGSSDIDDVTLTYSWELYGVGVISTQETFSHQFTQPGWHDIILTVSDGTDQDTVTLRVLVLEPVTVISTNTTIGAGDLTYDGKNLRVDGAVLTIDGVHSFQQLELVNGSGMLHPATTTASEPGIMLDIDYRFALSSGSQVDVSGQGYPSGYTIGNTTTGAAAGGSGGSYAGYGRQDGGNATNEVYGDFRDPRELGSGPGSGYGGSAGGGTVQINAQVIELAGPIRANGGARASGGSINLQCDQLIDSGGVSLLQANGGNGTYPGGGGRIAVIAGSASSAFDLTNAEALAGTDGGSNRGGAGTVYLAIADRGAPVLELESIGSSLPPGIPPTPLWFGVRNDALDDPSEFIADLALGTGVWAWMDTTATLWWSPATTTVIQNARLFADHWRVTNLEIRSGGSLSHQECTTSRAFRLELEADGQVHVQSGGEIRVIYRGYLPDYTDGNQPAPWQGGGSHGGWGSQAVYNERRNPPYDDFLDPLQPGGGGEDGRGGGAIRITAASVLNEGTISASAWSSRSGAGGSVSIHTGSYSGAGIVHAKGGDYWDGTWSKGGGGGGRIALYYDNGTLDEAKFSAAATDDKASAGTIYLRRTGDTYGKLIVDNDGLTPKYYVPATPIWYGDRLAASGTQGIAPEDFTIEARDGGAYVLDGDIAAFDADHDGLPGWEEAAIGTDPRDHDSNDDGVDDGVSVDLGIDPLNTDQDGDGISNADELAQGSDPFEADTDGDGVADGSDIDPLDPAYQTWPSPDPGDTTPPVITITWPHGATILD